MHVQPSATPDADGSAITSDVQIKSVTISASAALFIVKLSFNFDNRTKSILSEDDLSLV